jgi:hypothetical protein
LKQYYRQRKNGRIALIPIVYKEKLMIAMHWKSNTGAHADCSLLQIAIRLLGFSIAVVQSPLAALSLLGIGKRDVLIARVVIHAYYDRVRLLSPEPLVVNNQSLPGSKEPTLL